MKRLWYDWFFVSMLMYIENTLQIPQIPISNQLSKNNILEHIGLDADKEYYIIDPVKYSLHFEETGLFIFKFASDDSCVISVLTGILPMTRKDFVFYTSSIADYENFSDWNG